MGRSGFMYRIAVSLDVHTGSLAFWESSILFRPLDSWVFSKSAQESTQVTALSTAFNLSRSSICSRGSTSLTATRTVDGMTSSRNASQIQTGLSAVGIPTLAEHANRPRYHRCHVLYLGNSQNRGLETSCRLEFRNDDSTTTVGLRRGCVQHVFSMVWWLHDPFF